MFVGIETAARCKLIAQPEIAVKLSACGYQIDLLDEFDTLLPNEQIFKSLNLLPFHLFPFPLFPFSRLTLPFVVGRAFRAGRRQ
jgi:hypothetical protein